MKILFLFIGFYIKVNLKVGRIRVFSHILLNVLLHFSWSKWNTASLVELAHVLYPMETKGMKSTLQDIHSHEDQVRCDDETKEGKIHTYKASGSELGDQHLVIEYL